jgi:hypothetical protein
MAVQTFPVQSSAISQLAFDLDEDWLEVTFVKGGTYRIPNFPQDVLETWMNADSIGGFWNSNVRGRY